MKIAITLAACLGIPAAVAFSVLPSLSHEVRIQTRLDMVAPTRRQVISQALMWTTTMTALVSPALAERPMYLTEPTEDFKESERQRAEFRKAQLVIKDKFNVVLDRFTTKSKTEKELEADLRELRDLVIATGGLPLGILKVDMYKQIRTIKAKGFWPTKVEIAYQDLKNEISYQQSPNTEKDTANPL